MLGRQSVYAHAVKSTIDNSLDQGDWKTIVVAGSPLLALVLVVAVAAVVVVIPLLRPLCAWNLLVGVVTNLGV